MLRLAAAPLALACLAIAAGGAEAKVARAFYGVEATPRDATATPMSQADFDRMRSARVGTLRLSFNYESVEKTEGAPRDWTYYDAMVARAARARVDILAILLGRPNWAAASGGTTPLTEAGQAGFIRFVGDIVERYGHGGSYWRTHRSLPRRPIAAYQVWNEPNYPPYWAGGRTRAADYAALLRPVARTIRAADRRATIGLAGLLAASSEGSPGYRYLDDLYRLKGIRRYFDAVAIHPYSETARGIEGELTRIRRVMRRHGDGRTPVWITEVGWGTGGDSPYLTVTPAAQARRLRASFRLVSRKRARYRVRKLIWFSWSDREGRPDRGWEFYCGLFGLDGRPKPAWPVFRRFTRATR